MTKLYIYIYICIFIYIYFQSVDVCEVLELLNNLDQKSGKRGETVYSSFLKSFASELPFPLCKILKSSLRESFVPRNWLSSIAVPIYKKSFRYDPLK